MNGSLAADTQLNKNKLSGMDPLLIISGDEYVEVVKRATDGSYRNYRVLTSKLKETRTAYDFAVSNGFVGTLEEWLECTKALYSRDESRYGKVLMADDQGVGQWTEVNISTIDGLQEELDRVLSQAQSAAQAAATSANTASLAADQVTGAVTVAISAKNSAQSSASSAQSSATRAVNANNSAESIAATITNTAIEVQNSADLAIAAKDMAEASLPVVNAAKDAAQSSAASAASSAAIATSAKDSIEAIVPTVTAAKDTVTAMTASAIAASDTATTAAQGASASKDAAASSASSATSSKDAAAVSAAQALASRNATEGFANNAATSVTSAQNFATQAESSKVAAASSTNFAQTAAAQAIASKDAAASSATAAQTAATQAGTARTAAQSSATAAASSQTAAQGFQANAQQSATDAAASAQAAAAVTNNNMTLLAAPGGSGLVTYHPGDLAVGASEDRTLQVKLDGYRDLADFKGFVGDGTNDDSDAYERAVLWQRSKAKIWNPTFGGGVSSAVVVCPGLTIPKGARVRLTRTMPAAIHVVANGFASFEASTTVDMILGNDSYRSHYENIFFIGGRNQVNLNNKNVNFGLWMFRNCTFAGSNGWAVQLRNTATDYGVTSTQAIFDNCRWTRCRRVLFTECDHTFVTGGWLQVASDWFDDNTSAIKNVGLLSMSDLMMVPGGTFGLKCRWVDAYGGVRFTKVRFGGEGGGLPGVYWFATPTKFVAGTDESVEVGVIFESCTNYFGNQVRADNGGVVLQGQLPRIIRYTNCTGPIGGRLIHNDPADGGIPDIPAYIANLRTAWGGVDDMYQNLSYHYTGIGMRPVAGIWPSALDAYSYTDRGRVVETRAHLTASGTVVMTGVATRMSFDVATLDPYKYSVVSSGATVVKIPLRASFAQLICNLEAPTLPANNQRYTARVYVQGVATNIIAYYDHTKDGQPRFNFSGGLVVTPGQEIDVRITQSTGASATFTGTITVDFDVRQF
jgi:hypothetical protein